MSTVRVGAVVADLVGRGLLPAVLRKVSGPLAGTVWTWRDGVRGYVSECGRWVAAAFLVREHRAEYKEETAHAAA